MTFIELFAGIGGFRLGLEQSGHKCVWANEWEEKPRNIYNYNFNELPDKRDIRNVYGGDLPKADLAVGGFPCATFSYAGKRSGLSSDDTRGTLCFEMFRVIRQRRIPYLLFENVKGLLNNDNGRAFGTIIHALDEMGYDVQWELLDSQNFGVPQHRERIFLVGNLRGEPRPKVFPIGGETKNNAGGVESEDVPLIVRPCLTPTRLKKRQRGRRFKENGEPSFTLGVQDRHGVSIGEGEEMRIRKLTPLECERLQGLPDNFTKWLKNEDGNVTLNSDSDRYERTGRTVTIPVIHAIGKKLGHEWWD